MKLSLLLAKSFQFIIFVLFIFMVLVYFGFILMVALSVLFYAIRLVSLVLPTVLAVVVGIAVLGYLGMAVYRLPKLYNLVLEIGLDLINFGRTQIKRFDPLIADAKAEIGAS